MLSLDYFKNTFFFAFLSLLLGGIPLQAQIFPGAQQSEQYLPLLRNKKIGVIAHAASEIYHKGKATHLIDSLLAHKIDIKKIFALQNAPMGIPPPNPFPMTKISGVMP